MTTEEHNPLHYVTVYDYHTTIQTERKRQCQKREAKTKMWGRKLLLKVRRRLSFTKNVSYCHNFQDQNAFLNTPRRTSILLKRDKSSVLETKISSFGNPKVAATPMKRPEKAGQSLEKVAMESVSAKKRTAICEATEQSIFEEGLHGRSQPGYIAHWIEKSKVSCY